MRLLRSLLFDVLMYALMPIIGILGAPFAIWSVDGAYRVMKAYCGAVFWLLRVICGIRVEVRGEIPEGDVIVASKHQSFLDIMMHTYYLPRVRFIMKKQLRWAPVVGLYALRIGSTPVDRGKKAQAMREMVAGVQKDGDTRHQLIIYPQGTRTLPGVKQPYRIGAGVLYQRLGKTCVPAATNVGVFWARRSRYRNPGLAVIEFLPPIEPGLPIPEFMRRLETVVEEHSDRLMREAGFPIPETTPDAR
jgi:1-acyl-sn-glycerol-3-phosphate acyltransferase